MAINLATLNVKGLKYSSKCARLLSELKNVSVDVAAVQETHFICAADCRVLENDFNVFSAYGSHTSVGVSLLVGRSLDADVNVVFAGDGGQLVVADVAVKSWWVSLRTLLASGTAERQRRSAPTRIRRQDRASWTTPNSRLPGDLHGTRCPFSAWTSELAAAVV